MNTDKLKEEILGLSFYPHECVSMIDCVTKQDALKAMDSHAEQISILFNEWMGGGFEINIHNKWICWNDKYCELYGLEKPNPHDPITYTNKELYPIFISELNKPNQP